MACPGTGAQRQGDGGCGMNEARKRNEVALTGALPLRRYAPTPGFIAWKPIRMEHERAQQGRPPREERPIRLGTRLGAQVASPRCPILRASIHEHRTHRTKRQERRFDKRFAIGYIGVAGARRPSAILTTNGTSRFKMYRIDICITIGSSFSLQLQWTCQ